MTVIVEPRNLIGTESLLGGGLFQAARSRGGALAFPPLEVQAPPASSECSRDSIRAPGFRLGPYRLVGLLRAGGMGEVHRAVDERLDRAVALKILLPRQRNDAHARRRLRDEARRLSSIRHRSVCTLYDLGHQDGVDFLVMEYIEGRTLAERLEAGPIAPPEAVEIARQLASALDAVHRAGVVHGDLKPANIMLVGPEDGEPVVKLLDFGLARQIGAPNEDDGGDSATRLTRTDPHLAYGTWPYMAPELFGDGVVDQRTDIWGLGVVLYEMVCGRRPFPQRSAPALAAAILRTRPPAAVEVVAGCGNELSAVIERCLDQDPARRWASCVELLAQLDDCPHRVLPAGPNGEIDVTPPPAGRAVHRPGFSARDTRRRSQSFLRRVGAVAIACTALAAAAPPSRAQASPAEAVATAQLDRSQMEDFLLRGRITDLKTLRTGVTRSSRAQVTWNDASHDAHVQTIDSHLGSTPLPNRSDSYRYNVAAYRLDKMLDLNMVPVSVRAKVHGSPAALTWWVDDVAMMEIDRRKQGIKPADARAWNQQMHRSNVFQELVANSDFNQTNVLITSDWRIWLVDFTRAFRTHPRLMKPELLTKLDPRLREALERLDPEAMGLEMKDLLSKSQIRGILARRDLILEHFEARGARTAAALQEPGAAP